MNNRHQRTSGLVACTVAITAALSMPTSALASNQLSHPYAEPPSVLRNDIAHFGRASTDGVSTARVPRPSTSAVVVRIDGGFDWPSAGAGAAAGVGLVLVVSGAGSLVRRRYTSRAALGS